jgi:hypothetical protein
MGLGGALVGVDASVAEQYPSQVYLLLRTLIEIEDLLCKPRDVYTCIALACKVEVVSCVFGVLLEELLQSHEVVLGDCSVIGAAILGGCIRETDAARTLQIEYVSVFVPGVGVRLHLGGVVGLEGEGTVLAEEGGERGAARPATEPKYYWGV